MPLRRAGHLFRRANANKGRMVRALTRTGRSGFWAMADQGVASLGNFGINILLARELAARGALGEYGNFGMLFELMLVLNSLQAGLIVYPLTVKGATVDRAALARMAGAGIILTLLAGPIVAGGMVAMAVAISTLHVGLWSAIAAVLWQVQETTRRALMAELRFKSAIWGDSASYLGQFVGVWALARWGTLDLAHIFQVMAVTSLLGATIQSIQLRLRVPGATEIAAFAREAWRLGRWVLGGNLSSACTSTLYTINFRYWWGAEIVGVAFALNNLLRLTNPLMFSIVSLITPHAARARASEGLTASMRVFLRFSALGALILGPYLAVLIFLPGLSIKFALKHPQYQAFWWVLVISAISQGLIYVGVVMGAFLNAVERSRLSFMGQIVYAATFVVVGMPATAKFGIAGAALGGLVAAILQVFVNLGGVRIVTAEHKAAVPQRGVGLMAG